MTDILDLDIDEDLEEIERAVGDLEIADIAAAFADDGGQAAEAAGLVAERHADAADMGVLGVAGILPGDVEPALGRIGKALQRLAIDGVDGDALAGRNDADYAVAGQRVAAAGEVQRHAGNEAANRHGILRRLALARARQRNDLAGLALRLAVGFLVWLGREDGVDDFAAGQQPLANSDKEVVDAGAIEILEYRLEVPLGE